MDVLKKTDLQELVDMPGKWHVSIYMPTHRTGREQQQDPIRLKNLLADAEKKLVEYEVRRPEVEKMLRPAEELLLLRDFWQHQSEGLAIFLSEDHSKVYRLPDRFDEMVVVSNGFYVKPILPLLNGNGNFYLLVLNLNQVRLFHATRDNLSEIPLGDMHTSLEEAFGTADQEKNIGFHTSTDNSGGGGERPAIFYGQGVEYEKKDDILRFFREVDAGLSRLLEDESAPMVIAAVEYLHSLYQEANNYRNLLKEGIVGSPERQDIKELHEQAWKIVEPIFIRSRQQAVDRFLELHGQQNGLATSDLESAVKAAVAGRVETLIVPLGVQKWGRYDSETDSVQVASGATPEHDDLLNFAAVQTLLNSGNVYAVPADQLPNSGDIAAIFRYAM